MADDQKDSVADDQKSVMQTEAQAPAMTSQELANKMNHLIDEAKAAGLNPVPVLYAVLAARGMGLLDQARATAAGWSERFLTALETGNAKTSEKK